MQNNLGSDPIRPLVWRIAFPSMLAQFVSVLYSIVDRIYISNIPLTGETALAGVGVCGPVVTMLGAFAFLVGVGGAPLMSINMGAGRPEEARRILSNSFLVLCVCAVVLTAVVFPLQRPMLMFFGASEVTYPYAEEYFSIYLCGTVFNLLSLGMNQFIISQGLAKKGMFSVVLGAALNIALDPLFIFVFNMNVAGAAIATIISQFLTFVFVVTFLRLKNTKIRLTFVKPELRITGRIIKLGISPFIIMASDSLIIIVQNAILQARGGADGDMWITVSTVVQAFFSLTSMPMLGISEGSQPVLSYAYGAKNERLIKRAELWITVACLVFTTFMTVMSIFCAPPFVRLFTQNAEIAEKSVWGIRVFMMGVIPLSFQYAFVDCFTALGQPKYAITLSLARKVVFFLGALIAFPLIWDVSAAFYAEPFADIAAAILTSICFAIFFPKVIRRRINGEDDLKKRRFHHRRQKTAE